MRARGQRWLNEFQQRIYDVLAGSKYYDAKHQLYEDEIAFATGTMLIYEDRETVINCQVPCAGEYFLGTDGLNNRSVFNREFTMTVRQLMSRSVRRRLSERTTAISGIRRAAISAPSTS